MCLKKYFVKIDSVSIHFEIILFSDKVFAPSNDIDMDKADDSDRVVEQYKRFLAGFPSPSPDKPRVRPKVELDLKNIFKKKPAVFNSNGNVSSPGVETAPNTTSS